MRRPGREPDEIESRPHPPVRVGEKLGVDGGGARVVGTLPEGATSTTVVAYITEAINALSIGDYAKTTEVTAAINTALESYYTKTQVDETFVKKADIVMATDEEVDAMLTEVFGAQAAV